MLERVCWCDCWKVDMAERQLARLGIGEQIGTLQKAILKNNNSGRQGWNWILDHSVGGFHLSFYMVSLTHWLFISISLTQCLSDFGPLPISLLLICLSVYCPYFYQFIVPMPMSISLLLLSLSVYFFYRGLRIFFISDIFHCMLSS